MLWRHDKLQVPTAADALPGRAEAMPVPERHFVNGNRIVPPFPEGMELALFAMGCFWGAERIFWKHAGVYSTAVGYAAGSTPNPTYREVCSGLTGHTEGVRVVFDPAAVRYEDLLQAFWENHDPTQGMRQGNDVGTQYRSGIYTYSDAQLRATPTRSACGPPATASSPPRSCRRRSSTTPKSTTSSTWRRTRAATAASAAPASVARWA
jgi:peptide-methionine (S)-S-oxide reductase